MPVLKDLLENSKDGEWGKSEPFDESVEMSVIRGTDFESARVGSVEGVPERFIAKRYHDRKVLKPWDILLETAGGSKNRPTGRTLLVKHALLRTLGKPATCASFARFLRIDNSKAYPPYVFWLLQHLYSNGILFKYHTQHTGVARFQYTSFAENEELILPSSDLQVHIASILTAYDDLIENNTRRIEILEEMARRLYEEWFVHFRFPGHEAVGFKESELGEIPAGWEVKSVVDTFQIMGGGTPSKKVPEYWEDGDINWFSPTDLTRSSSAFMEESSSKITELGLKKSSAKLFPENSVMMTSRATIGVVAINTQPAATNQGFITCLPNNEFPLYLMYHWLKDNVETFISLGTGATFKEISKGTFKEIQLAVPPVDVSRAYQEVVGPMMQQVLLLQRKNANLRTQRDLLLPKLVSGEIDVSNILMANDKEVEAA